MSKKISISILTIIIIASMHKIETKTYGYSKSDCQKHRKEWRNGKCRDKRKILPQVQKSKNQIAQLGSVTGSSLHNQASDITVIFYDKIGGKALTNSDLPKNILASGATVNIPTSATYLKIGPDTQDFDTAQLASTELMSNTQYVIGADANGNLAIGVSSNVAAPSVTTLQNSNTSTNSMNIASNSNSDNYFISTPDQSINNTIAGDASNTNFANTDTLNIDLTNFDNNQTFDFSSSF